MAHIFFIDIVGLSMLSDDTKLIMAGDLFWNNGFDLLFVYHSKAMAPLTGASCPIVAVCHAGRRKLIAIVNILDSHGLYE